MDPHGYDYMPAAHASEAYNMVQQLAKIVNSLHDTVQQLDRRLTVIESAPFLAQAAAGAKQVQSLQQERDELVAYLRELCVQHSLPSDWSAEGSLREILHRHLVRMLIEPA